MAKDEIHEFRLKSDYRSPNASLKDNKLVFKNFSSGDTYAGHSLNGQNSNINKQVSPTATFISKEGWLVPAVKLEKKSNTRWANFDDYNKDKNTLKTEDLPPEVIKKVEEIANKNMGKNMGKMVSNNLKIAMLGLGGGLAYSFIAKKNVYLWGIGGLFVGLMVTAFMSKPLITEPKEEEKK